MDCTDCNEPLTEAECVRNKDAVDVEHAWHPMCWVRFRWWLAGHDGEPSKQFVERILK